MTRNCQHCQESFEAKRETAKFCSTSCRVMYSRKHKKPKLREAVIENEILQALGEMKELRKQIADDLIMFGAARSDGKPLTGFRHDTPISVIPVSDDNPMFSDEKKDTYMSLLNGMATITFGDEKEEYAIKIRAATHLPDEQIQKLLNTLWLK